MRQNANGHVAAKVAPPRQPARVAEGAGGEKRGRAVLDEGDGVARLRVCAKDQLVAERCDGAAEQRRGREPEDQPPLAQPCGPPPSAVVEPSRMASVVRKRSRMLSASAPRRDTIDLEIGWFGLMPLREERPCWEERSLSGSPMSGLELRRRLDRSKEIVRALARRPGGSGVTGIRTRGALHVRLARRLAARLPAARKLWYSPRLRALWLILSGQKPVAAACCGYRALLTNTPHFI